MPSFDWYHLIYPRTWWFFCSLTVTWTRDLNAVWLNVDLFDIFILYLMSNILRAISVQLSKKIVLNGGISGAYALDLPRLFFTLTVMPVYPRLLSWCGGCGEQYLSAELSTRAIRIVLCCHASTCPCPFQVSPSCCFFTFFRACVGGGRIRFGSDFDPSMCNSTLCFSKLCSFLTIIIAMWYCFGLDSHF